MKNNFDNKPGSIEEVIAGLTKHTRENAYQDMFKKELEKSGKGIGAMTPKEKSAFFSKIDKKYKAKDENIKETVDETHVGQTKKANQSQKDAKGEKEVIKPIRETILNMWQEAADEKKDKNASPIKEKEVEEEEVKKGYHKMPDGKIMKDTEHKKEEEEPKKDEDKTKAELEKKNDEVTLLKQKVDLEKAKAVNQDTKKMVNPETGEPLLQVGVAYKALRDMMKKEEIIPAKEKKVSETELKNKKRTDTGEKPSQIEPNPEIKYNK